MNFGTIDIIVFVVYVIVVVGVGLWVSREKKGVKKDSKDYFLASKALPWWAVGASLIASNISAEQFIGMSGEISINDIDTLTSATITSKAVMSAVNDALELFAKIAIIPDQEVGFVSPEDSIVIPEDLADTTEESEVLTDEE